MSEITPTSPLPQAVERKFLTLTDRKQILSLMEKDVIKHYSNIKDLNNQHALLSFFHYGTKKEPPKISLSVNYNKIEQLVTINVYERMLQRDLELFINACLPIKAKQLHLVFEQPEFYIKLHSAKLASEFKAYCRTLPIKPIKRPVDTFHWDDDFYFRKLTPEDERKLMEFQTKVISDKFFKSTQKCPITLGGFHGSELVSISRISLDFKYRLLYRSGTFTLPKYRRKGINMGSHQATRNIFAKDADRIFSYYFESNHNMHEFMNNKFPDSKIHRYVTVSIYNILN